MMHAVAAHDARTNAYDRTPPANVDVEGEVLAALMMAPSALAQVQPILKPEYFFEPLHGTLYRTIQEIAASAGMPTAGHLQQRLGPMNREVKNYIWKLTAQGGMTGEPLVTHARVVRDLWALRQIEAAGTEIGLKTGYDPGALLTDTFAIIDQVRAAVRCRALNTVSMAGLSDALMGAIEADLQGLRKDCPATGIARLDRELGGGLHPSTLITVAARTSMGKSILGLEIVAHAGAQGFGCVYHSLEMSSRQIAARMASSSLERRSIRIPFEQILRRGGVNAAQAQEIANTLHWLKRLPVTIQDGGGRTMQDIALSSERLVDAFLQKGIPPGPIVIDHAHIVREARRYNREDERLKEVADSALALAKHLDLPVVLLAQCNRNTESRDDKRPSLADLRGAGAFEENSDAVVFLYRPAYYVERSAQYREGDAAALDEYDALKHVIEIIVDKNRAGRSNQVVQAFVDPALNAIRNKDHGNNDLGNTNHGAGDR